MSSGEISDGFEGAGAPARSKRRWLVVAALLLAALVAGAAAFLLTGGGEGSSPAPTPAPASETGIVAAEGALTVGTGPAAVEVPQLPCTTSEEGAFECDADASEPVTVSAPAGALALESGASTSFTVSTVSLSDGGVAPVAFSGGALHFEDAPPGTYSVTVLGEDQGGRRASWQFLLEVTP